MENELKNRIQKTVNDSDWQPEFEYSEDLYAVVDKILEPHEDYELMLHNRVIDIIERETNYAERVCDYTINFDMIAGWQSELLTEKWRSIKNAEKYDGIDYHHLPNLYIGIGLRNSYVKVGSWNPPAPHLLGGLINMCFPFQIEYDSYIKNSIDLWSRFNAGDFVYIEGEFVDTNDFENPITDYDARDTYILNELTQWYKTFETIHFLNDLNGRIGAIIVNIVSKILTGKYLLLK